MLTKNCSHENAYLESACCSQVGSSGYIECGCNGLDNIICPDCELQIDNEEYIKLYEKLLDWS